jgi:hypothetical protein
MALFSCVDGRHIVVALGSAAITILDGFPSEPVKWRRVLRIVAAQDEANVAVRIPAPVAALGRKIIGLTQSSFPRRSITAECRASSKIPSTGTSRLKHSPFADKYLLLLKCLGQRRGWRARAVEDSAHQLRNLLSAFAGHVVKRAALRAA